MDTTDANNNNGNFESICGISTFPSGRGLSGKSNQLEVHHPSPGRGWRALSGALGSLNTTECNSHSRVQTGSKGKAPCLRALFMPKSELEGRNKTLQIFSFLKYRHLGGEGYFSVSLEDLFASKDYQGNRSNQVRRTNPTIFLGNIP